MTRTREDDEADEPLAALEARLAEDPDDTDAWMVYGDLLQKRGDPHGELAALQRAAAGEPGRGGTKAALASYVTQHVPTLLGALAAHVRDARDLAAPPFEWRHGFIHRAELAAQPGLVEQLLTHPSGRLLVELSIRADTAADAAHALAELVRVAPPTLHELDLLARADGIDVGDLWARVPRLQRLSITARSVELGDLRLPAMQRVRILAFSLSSDNVAALALAPWPQLERLELRLATLHGDEPADFADLAALLRRTDLPALTHLRLRSAPFAGAIARAIATGPLASQLELLDLSHGAMTPQDVRILAQNAYRFGKLKELWLPQAALAGDAPKLLAGIATHVIGDARAPLDTLERDLGK